MTSRQHGTGIGRTQISPRGGAHPRQDRGLDTTQPPQDRALSAVRPILDTQRALSTLWLDLGAEAARHAGRSMHLSLGTLAHGRRPGDLGAVAANAQQMLESYLQLTSFAIGRYGFAGKEIASAWARHVDRDAPGDRGGVR